MKEKREKIIAPVPRELIKGELTAERFIRNTNKAGNKIYIINYHNAPNTMREIGRLREMSFRCAGGGTGLSMDIDEADTRERCYEQLIVYNPREQEIIGGYRFIPVAHTLNPKTGEYEISTTHYFNFSEQMKSKYLIYSIELGRSWVQPDYQPGNNSRKGFFALMNVWDGLGSLVIIYPKIKYFIGKVTMYTHYNKEARDILLSFLNHYFPNRPDLCSPKPELLATFDDTIFKQHFHQDTPYDKGFKLLHKLLKEQGEWIPPLINIYMNLSHNMITFGTARNSDFGNVEEIGMLITLADIHQKVKDQHIDYQ